MEGDDPKGAKGLDWYVKQINRRIVEMKLESCPIDQILRAASNSNHSTSMKRLLLLYRSASYQEQAFRGDQGHHRRCIARYQA